MTQQWWFLSEWHNYGNLVWFLKRWKKGREGWGEAGSGTSGHIIRLSLTANTDPICCWPIFYPTTHQMSVFVCVFEISCSDVGLLWSQSHYAVNNCKVFMPLQGLFTAGAGEVCCSPRCILMRLLYSAKKYNGSSSIWPPTHTLSIWNC